MSLINPFSLEGSWHRANFHCHTTLSDGDTPLEERVEQYRQQGYDVLAITDHEKTNDVTAVQSPDMLVMSGMETHPPDNNGAVYHFVCLNVPHGFSLTEEPDPHERLRKVKEAGGEVIIAHPYWCGYSIDALLPFRDAIAVEVYNATCTKVGKAFSSVHWDDMLMREWEIPAVAVDDTHRGRDIFMGWTMLRMTERTPDAVLHALRTGAFYSSCGPEIHDFGVQDGKAWVQCSPASEIHFIASGPHGSSVYADDGPLLDQAEVPVHPHMRYVRAEVVGPDGQRAWTNPVFLNGAV